MMTLRRNKKPRGETHSAKWQKWKNLAGGLTPLSFPWLQATGWRFIGVTRRRILLPNARP